MSSAKRAAMREIPDYELGWLVGIIEGEGCIGVRRDKKRGQDRGFVRVNMTDKEVVERCQALTGFGRVTGPYQEDRGKGIWSWQVQSMREVDLLLRVVAPLLTPRRQTQARQAQEAIQERRAAPSKRWKTHCLRGHFLGGRNLRENKDGSRSCRACHRLYEQRRRRSA